jgi:hypothetical protein
MIKLKAVIVGDLQQQDPALRGKSAFVSFSMHRYVVWQATRPLLAAKEAGHLLGQLLLPHSTKTAGTTEHAQSPSKAIRHLKYIQGNVNIPVRPSQSWCDRKEIYRRCLLVRTIVDKNFLSTKVILFNLLAPSSMSKYIGVFVREVKRSDVPQ